MSEEDCGHRHAILSSANPSIGFVHDLTCADCTTYSRHNALQCEIRILPRLTLCSLGFEDFKRTLLSTMRPTRRSSIGTQTKQQARHELFFPLDGTHVACGRDFNPSLSCCGENIINETNKVTNKVKFMIENADVL